MKKYILTIISICFLISLFGCKGTDAETRTSGGADLKTNFNVSDVGDFSGGHSMDSSSNAGGGSISSTNDAVSSPQAQSSAWETDNEGGSRPIKFFQNLDEFQSWIENPALEIDKPVTQYGREYNNSICSDGRDYNNSIYSDIHRMFAVDRFYLLPIVPDGFQPVERGCHISLWDVTFLFEDTEGNKCGFSYRTDGNVRIDNQNVKTKKDDTSYFVNPVLKTDILNGKKYFLSNSPQGSPVIYQYFNDYLCNIGIDIKNNAKFNFPTKVDADTDIAYIVSKVNFKRVDLPPV